VERPGVSAGPPLPRSTIRRVASAVEARFARTALDVDRQGRSGNPEIAGLNRSCAGAVGARSRGCGRRDLQAVPRGRKLRLSSARRSALQLQGRYMGHVRTLRPKAKGARQGAQGHQGHPSGDRPRQEAREGVKGSLGGPSRVAHDRLSAEFGRDHERLRAARPQVQGLIGPPRIGPSRWR